jgi:uncharacterized protein YgbK (DUF1537 family)
VQESFIPDIIARQSRIPVQCFSSGAFPAGGKGGLMVFDCECNCEMAALAAALHERNLLHASAGCAGFAEALMKFIPFRRVSSPVSLMPPPEPRPLLVILGSVNPVSVGQARAALRSGIRGIPLSVEKLCEDAWFASAEAGNMMKQCSDALRADGICLIGTNRALGSEVPDRQSAPAGVHEENISGRLGKLVPGIMGKDNLYLAVFGGDTLLGIMDALGFNYILPICEIRPGIVFALAQGGGGEIFIVTKSGAFGGEGLIAEIQDFLKKTV